VIGGPTILDFAISQQGQHHVTVTGDLVLNKQDTSCSSSRRILFLVHVLRVSITGLKQGQLEPWWPPATPKKEAPEDLKSGKPMGRTKKETFFLGKRGCGQLLLAPEGPFEGPFGVCGCADLVLGLARPYRSRGSLSPGCGLAGSSTST
jgi:hypothetical protein